MAKVALDRGGYIAPDFGAPLRPELTRSGIAANAMVKGFYFNAVLRELREQGHHLAEFGPYRDFGDYPITAAFDLVLAAVKRLYPHEPLREGIRRLAWSMFPILLGTMVGRVVFGALGSDIKAITRHSNRGFEISMNRGRCEPLVVEDGYSEIRVTDFQLLPDCFLVGVYEGFLAHYGLDGEVFIKPGQKPQDMDFLIRWR